jgi:hypothetical protein
MRLDRRDRVAGHPIKKARDFLNYVFRDDEKNAAYVERMAADEAKWFGKDSPAVLGDLLARGWIKKGERIPTLSVAPLEITATFELTEIGKRARIAKLLAPCPRAKGEAIIAGLLKRVDEVNARSELMFFVEELRLFGSMIDPSVEMVGDVDVAVSLVRRKPPKGKGLVEWNEQRAVASGRSSLSFRDIICYGETEVRRLLKARVALLSLHDVSELELIGTKSETLFILEPGSIAKFERASGRSTRKD